MEKNANKNNGNHDQPLGTRKKIKAICCLLLSDKDATHNSLMENILTGCESRALKRIMKSSDDFTDERGTTDLIENGEKIIREFSRGEVVIPQNEITAIIAITGELRLQNKKIDTSNQPSYSPPQTTMQRSPAQNEKR